MNYSKLIGVGGYVPEKILTNKALESMVDTTDEWIRERCGIEQRHIAAPGEMASDMAVKAAQHALEFANCTAKEVELIIVATSTPDKVFPSTACIVQEKLGVPPCPAFDISAACTGFIYALSIADQFIKTGMVQSALIVGSEIMSSILDWQDRSTCVLFGDGAGAVLLKRSEQPGIYSTHIEADGHYADLLYVTNQITQPGTPPYLKMSGHEVFKQAVTKMGELVLDSLEQNHITRAELDWLIPHQANLRIINAITKRLNMDPEEDVITTVQIHGNTSAASIPLALDKAIRDGRIQPGQRLLMPAFGGGFTWGAALLQY